MEDYISQTISKELYKNYLGKGGRLNFMFYLFKSSINIFFGLLLELE